MNATAGATTAHPVPGVPEQNTPASANFTIEQMTTPDGTVVSEYVGPDATVFAVTWRGAMPPDVQTLLGTYFKQYRDAADNGAPSPLGLHASSVQAADVKVDTAGHMGFMWGARVSSSPPSGRRDHFRDQMKPRKVVVFAAVAMVLAALASAGTGFAAPNNFINANVFHGLAGNGVDQPFGSVVVCVPGTTQCQTMSRLLIDTGSFGLRIFSQALTISLPVQTSGGQKIAECAYFGSVTTWGRVATADVKMGGEPTIPNLPVQIINPNYGHLPAICNDGKPLAQTPLQENFNGILGVGLIQSDCPRCASVPPSNGDGYYSCTSTSCTQTTRPLGLQVQNPVALLPPNPSNGNIPDDNGVMLKFTLPPPTGASILTG
jgi:hypothetical protein